MKGENKLILNGETVKEAIEEYLDRKMMGTHQAVMGYSLINNSYDRDPSLEVLISECLPKEEDT